MKLSDIVFETYGEVLKIKRGWFDKRKPVKIDYSFLNIKNQEIDPYIREIINQTYYTMKDLRKGRFTMALGWIKDKARYWKRRWELRDGILFFIFPYGFKYWLWTYRCKRNYRRKGGD